MKLSIVIPVYNEGRTVCTLINKVLDVAKNRLPQGFSDYELVIVEDGSSEGSEPKCHWLVWGLAGQRGKLLEGETPPRTGKNSQGNSEWLLPDPPEGETRHYVFQLFATELPLTLMPGASRARVL